MNAKIDLKKIPRGHQPHRSGAGAQKHRSTNRNRTRQQQNRRALAE